MLYLGLLPAETHNIMSLIFHDGFDEYSTYADMQSIGGWGTNGNPTLINTFRAVGGGKCLRLEGLPGQYAYIQFPDQSGNTVFVGFAHKLEGDAGFDGDLVYINCSTGSHLQIHWDGLTSNRYQLYDNTTLLAQGPASSVDPAVEHLIQLKIKIAATGGICDMIIDGNTHFSYTGDTQYGACTALEWVYFAYPAGVHSNYIDDLWICNDQGTINNTYLGDMLAKFTNPTSDDSVQWTKNTGADNHSAVDDPVGSPDGDTTYIADGTSGHKDVYGYSTLTQTHGGAFAGVKLVTNAKSESGAISIKAGIKSGANEQQVEHALTTSYAPYTDYFETSDGATTPFTITTIDSLQSTIEVV